MRHDPQPSTQTPPHPTPSADPPPADAPEGDDPPDGGTGATELLAACGITDLRALIGQLHDHRRQLSRPITPWSRRRVLAALDDAAAAHHGWPPSDATRALLTIAADRHTTSPMRLTAPGPWWNTPPPGRPATVQLPRLRHHGRTPPSPLAEPISSGPPSAAPTPRTAADPLRGAAQ